VADAGRRPPSVYQVRIS